MKSNIIFEIFESGREGNRQWYWHARRRRGGKIVADGSEGYYKLGNAKRAVTTFITAVQVGYTLPYPEIRVIDTK